MTGGNDSTTNIRTSEIKLQEVRKDLVLIILENVFVFSFFSIKLTSIMKSCNESGIKNITK